MADEPEVATAVEPTEDQLMAELDVAMKSKDFKTVAAVSRKIDTLQKAREKVELDAKKAALDSMSDKVKAAITKAVTPIIDSKDLDAADGIWYSYDFGEQAPVLRLMKTTTKTKTTGASTGSGGGRKFNISTEDMLQRHANEEYKDGISFAQAYESSADKNWRYAIRQALLKKEGII